MPVNIRIPLLGAFMGDTGVGAGAGFALNASGVAFDNDLNPVDIWPYGINLSADGLYVGVVTSAVTSPNSDYNKIITLYSIDDGAAIWSVNDIDYPISGNVVQTYVALVTSDSVIVAGKVGNTSTSGQIFIRRHDLNSGALLGSPAILSTGITESRVAGIDFSPNGLIHLALPQFRNVAVDTSGNVVYERRTGSYGVAYYLHGMRVSLDGGSYIGEIALSSNTYIYLCRYADTAIASVISVGGKFLVGKDGYFYVIVSGEINLGGGNYVSAVRFLIWDAAGSVIFDNLVRYDEVPVGVIIGIANDGTIIGMPSDRTQLIKVDFTTLTIIASRAEDRLPSTGGVSMTRFPETPALFSEYY
jgi:hypothetical protein